jgi:hypothetical protein
MICPFFFPPCVNLRIAGLKEAQNLAGKVLRLIQIFESFALPMAGRLPTSWQMLCFSWCRNPTAANLQVQFDKRRQLFISSDNETPSVVAVRVGNLDCLLYG